MEWYIGEIRAVAFTTIPRGWLACNGQLLNISSNQALFSLLGVTFGGNGTTTFALPDLRGRSITGQGNGPNGQVVMGQISGTTSVTLIPDNLPKHTHIASASNTGGTTGVPDGAFWGVEVDATGATLNAYAPFAGTTDLMDPAALANSGGGQPVNIQQPLQVLNFLIATQGIYPSRS